jgi:outer membrane lipoprotein SlyB
MVFENEGQIMNRQSLVFVLLLSGSQWVAAAGEAAAPNEQYKAAKKEATARYSADKKLCAEEGSSSARMQCLRDAKADYDKALADAQKTASAATNAKSSSPVCAECGKVVGVVTGKKKGKTGALGVIGGGVAGALLGNQVGSGTGRTVATVAGAAGGAYAGNKVEEKLKETKFWKVSVKLDSGEERTIEFDHEPGVKSGDLVKITGTTITPR